MSKKIKNLIIVFIAVIAIFTAAHFALALDVGLEYGEATGLGTADPRVIAANIIRVALGFLGIIAVCLIMYAGWLWMTAEGNEKKIDKAKKVLLSAVIGLIIVLSAFAIASFVLNKLLEATGSGGEPGPGPGPPGPPSPDSFYIKSTVPMDEDTNQIRNITVKVFFNKAVDDSVDSLILENNFKIEKIAENITLENPDGDLVEPSVEVVGQVDISANRKKIDFKAVAECGDELSTQYCFDEWSKFEVTINSSSGIIAVGPQSLSCAGGSCQFVFSTDDSIDTSGPSAGIYPAQICHDDGTLTEDANIVGAWGKDDVGISSIEFYYQKQDDVEVSAWTEPGTCGKYQKAEYQYNTLEMIVGDVYDFRIEAADMADATADDSFTTDIKPGHCCNGVQDEDEEGVDCGGADCLSCWGGPCNKEEPNECGGAGSPNCDDYLCATWFCDCKLEDECICEAKPIIDWITPIGGFCNGDINTPCQNDGDCSSFEPATCNTDTPNGAAGNFITIGGRYFGAVAGTVQFSDNGGESWVNASLAYDVNNNCDNCWQDEQIIAIVPSGLDTGTGTIIQITANSGYFDTTGADGRGPEIDFAVNNIERPGLCKLNPDHGIMNEEIEYQGISLSDSTAYFGDILDYIIALNSDFTNDTQGTAEVPNIQTGKITSFIFNNSNISSNYLNFTKDEEPYLGPYITSFEPAQGNIGQYATIYGSGFGNNKGTSKIYFGDEVTGVEASYDFPDVCADSVWGDNQIIIKVPDELADGNYIFTIVIGEWTIDSSGLSPAEFTVDLSLDLKPSLCKIEPIMGPNNSEISLWGEYFDAKDDNSKIRFYSNQNQSGDDILFWDLDSDVTSGIQPYKAITTVHNEAVSGPVRVVKADPEIEGNGMNFTVGLCTEAGATQAEQDAACGSLICCPVGSTEEGKCKANEDDCYIAITSSVYEWDFSTGDVPAGPGEDCYDPESIICDDLALPQCAQDLFCDSGADCTCQTEADFDSCFGYSLETGSCDPILCPNSLGQCSAGQITGIGSCGDDYCNSAYSQCSDECVFANNKCKAGGSLITTCSVYEGADFNVDGVTVTLPLGYQQAQCNQVGENSYWQINPDGGSCPNQDWILDINDWCTLATTTTSLIKGACDLCANGFSCLDDSTIDNTGICYIGEEVCPAGTSCDGTQCVYTTALDMCECCCRLGFAAQDCCVPLECEGDCGSDAVGPDADVYGYCSSCRIDSDDDGSISVSEQKLSDAACNCEHTSGKFCDVDVDVDGDDSPDGICRDCAQLSTSGQCSLHSNFCCVDAMDSNACRGGFGGKDIILGDDPNLGYCAYFDCYDEDPYGCNTASSTTGSYSDAAICQDQCPGGPTYPPGASCYDGDDDACTLICGTGYGCMGESGCVETACGDDSTCLCCCDPSNDQCGAIYESLVCQQNIDPCTEDVRGLCCGCSADDQCSAGEPIDIGCGFDTCCRYRPEVSETFPVDGADSICRNTLITADFDQEMDIASFAGQVIVVGDYESEQCPESAQYLTFNKSQWTFVYKIKKLFSRIPLIGKFFIRQARALDGNFCAINGAVSGQHNADETTTLIFSPTQLLDANREYYVIIKGDENLGSGSGVLSYWDIGMNGPDTKIFNGLTFTNAKIWSFTTLGEQAENNGVCEIDHVEINPESYLFQTTDNDLNENDSDADDDSFDTIKDSDKVFMAKAISSDEQILAPVAGYAWEWAWNIDNPSIVDTVSVADLDEYKQLIRAQVGITDDNTFVNATATITEDDYLFPSTVGQQTTGSAEVWVFLCENPWPPVVDGSWQRWADDDANCSIADAGCYGTNYELYYCRDDGGEGTADDLPAILSEETIIRGSSTAQNVLKEFYFLREDTPSVTTVLTVLDAGTGAEVDASWISIAGVDGYKIYWGVSSGNYTNYKDVGNITSASIDSTDDLVNNEIYYFTLTSYYDSGAESDYYNEVDVTPTDSTVPTAPTGLVAVAGDGQVELSWIANTDDTVSYKVYYGASPGVYGASENVGDVTEAVVTNLTNGATYYFVITALDEYDNESGYSNEAAVTPIEFKII
ncbi:MAG: IPT/TIG domain-containing protein [Patescibacteria group bacterium]|nr:IPT/TIG domain-containing protein [Patescibacteria group bacterium]